MRQMATSPRHYQNSERKNAKTQDVFKQKKNMVLEKEISEERKKKLKNWITFYRRNLWFFCEHYMGVTLYPYQRYWINLISLSTTFLGIASRASAKSFIIAVYSIAKCILWPGTSIVLASSTKYQAGLIISEYCTMLRDNHPNIAREISSIVTNANKWRVDFFNNSNIRVVVSGDKGRGNRASVLVLEERRLIPTQTIDSILRPFLVSRKPGYVKNPKYAHLIEEPQEITITSAYYKSHEWFAETRKGLIDITNGDLSTRAIFLNYLISVKHGIKTKKQMEKEKAQSDPMTFLMEYGNIPFSSSSSAFLKLNQFNRSIHRAFYPQKEGEYNPKKNPLDIPKTNGELRICSVDVSMRKGAKNDNTIIDCARLFATKKGYASEHCYMESHNGQNTLNQALRIKQIFHDFGASVLIIDVANAGISVVDALSAVTKDDSRGIEYPAMTVMRHSAIDDKTYEDISERTLGKNADPVIFPISGTAVLNSMVAVSFRDRLRKKLISFLTDEGTAEDYWIKTNNKEILDPDDFDARAFILNPYLQASLCINECISLEMTVQNGGLIKLQEPSGCRKDRWSSTAYSEYYISLLDKDLLKETDGGSDWDSISELTFIM
jgi:hypothetical protein